MIPQKLFHKYKVKSFILCNCYAKDWQIENLLHRRSTSSAEVTALTLYVNLQVASVKGNIAHKFPSNSGAGSLGVSRSALLHPLHLVLTNTFGWGWLWYYCLCRCSWGFILQRSRCFGLVYFISLSANCSLWAQGPGVKVTCAEAPVGSRPRTACTGSTGLVFWLSSAGVARTSARLESSVSLVGTGPIDVTLSGMTLFDIGATLAGCFRPAWSLR